MEADKVSERILDLSGLASLSDHLHSRRLERMSGPLKILDMKLQGRLVPDREGPAGEIHVLVVDDPLDGEAQDIPVEFQGTVQVTNSYERPKPFLQLNHCHASPT